MKARGPAAIIRVRPEPSTSRLHAIAYVWHTKGEMVETLRRQGGVRRVRDTAAICREVEAYQVRRGRPARKLPVFAELHFHVARMGGGIVAHEFFHATAAWARRLGLDGGSIFRQGGTGPVCEQEERLCQGHGRMVAQFVNRAYREGLYG